MFKRIMALFGPDTANRDVPGTRAPASPAKKLGNALAAALVESGVDVSRIDPVKLAAMAKKLAA